MLSLFSVSPLEPPYSIPTSPASNEGAGGGGGGGARAPHPPTHPLLPPSLCIPLHWASILHKTVGLFFHWCPKRSSSTTYVTRAMGPSMLTLWLVVWSLGSLESLAGWYCCSSYGMLLQSYLKLLHWGPHAKSNGLLQASAYVFVRLWQSLSLDSYIRLLSACKCSEFFFLFIYVYFLSYFNFLLTLYPNYSSDVSSLPSQIFPYKFLPPNPSPLWRGVPLGCHPILYYLVSACLCTYSLTEAHPSSPNSGKGNPMSGYSHWERPHSLLGGNKWNTKHAFPKMCRSSRSSCWMLPNVWPRLCEAPTFHVI